MQRNVRWLLGLVLVSGMLAFGGCIEGDTADVSSVAEQRTEPPATSAVSIVVEPTATTKATDAGPTIIPAESNGAAADAVIPNEIPPLADADDVAEEADGWVGTFVHVAPGAQVSDYFEREDGAPFNVQAQDTTIARQIEDLRWTGALVRVWGELNYDVPGFPLIQVERIDVIAASSEESRNLAPFAEVDASSTLTTDEAAAYWPWYAVDGSLETAWVEGAQGPGIGETITLTFPGKLKVEYIGMDIGYDSSEAAFFANNRIKRVAITFSSGYHIDHVFDDERGVQMFDITPPETTLAETTIVRIVIADVYRGTSYDDTCVSEIQVWGHAH
jgi:hypothetical protein